MMECEVGDRLKQAVDVLKIREKILERKLAECHRCIDYKERLQITRWQLLKARLVLLNKEGGVCED